MNQFGFFPTEITIEILAKGLIIDTVKLLPTGSEERKVLGVGSIPVAILPSCQCMTNNAL